VAAVAEFFAAANVTRLPLADRAETTDSSVLKGTIQNTQYALTTTFGKIDLPAAKVVGIVHRRKSTAATQPGRPRVWLILTDGQVLAGLLVDPEIVFTVGPDSTLRIPISKLRQCAYRISKLRPIVSAITGPVVVLRDGHRLKIAEPTAGLHLQTAWGMVPLPPKSLLRIDAVEPKGAHHRARFVGGSSATGALPAKLTLTLALGSKLTVERSEVVRLVGGAEPATTSGSATMVLRNGDRLTGRFARELLTVRTEFGDASVHAPGLTSIQFDAQKPTSATVLAWDGAKLRGTLVGAAIAFQISAGGPKVNVPVGAIASITQATPSPPAEALKKLEHLVARLGAESWKDREAAQQALVKMDRKIVLLLKAYLKKEADPEVRQRLQEIIKALGGRP